MGDHHCFRRARGACFQERKTDRERERDEDGDYEEKDGEGSVRISVKKERG